MVSRDYTKEIGLKSGTPKLPWPIAIAVLAAFGVVVWFGVTKLQSLPSSAHSEEAAPAATAAKPAHHAAPGRK